MDRKTQTDVERIRQALKRHMAALQKDYHVQSLGIFGSYVRQEHDSASDLDVLVTFSEPPTLLEYVALENRLSDLLGIPVDLVMRDALRPRLGQRILEEVVAV